MSSLRVVKDLRRVFKTLTQQLSQLAPVRLYSEYINRMFDREYGLETDDIVEAQDLDVPADIRQHVTRYQATKIKVLKHILKQIPIIYNEFSFIDFGSGTGRAVLVATIHGFKRIIGIEISPSLHKTAQENIQKYMKKKRIDYNIELHCMNVNEFVLPEEQTLFYFYNPFDREIMAGVLENIEKSLIEKPRTAFLVYVFPLCIDLLEAATFLRLEGQGKICGD